MPQASKYDIEAWAKRASREFIADGRELNDSISEIAGDKGLNSEQIKRVVEAANLITNGEMVRCAKTAGSDPRVTFPMADAMVITSHVIAGSEPAKLARLKQTQKLASLFAVAPDAKGHEGLVKQARDAGVERRHSHMPAAELALAYANGVDVSAAIHTSDQVAGALVELASWDVEARAKLAALDNRQALAMVALASECEEQLHAGVTPATLAATVWALDVCDWHKAAALKVIDDCAGRLGVDVGQSQVKTASIVDDGHPLLSSVRELLQADADRLPVILAREKVASAQARAKADLAGGAEKIANVLGTIASKIPSAPGPIGQAGKLVGAAFTAADVKHRAQVATQRLKGMQASPVVGAMKTASSFGASQNFVNGLKSMLPSLHDVARLAIVAVPGTLAVMAADKILGAVDNNVGGIFERRKRDRIYEALVKLSPQFAGNPKAREYFDLIMTYAPSLSDHPTAISDFIKRQLQYPVTSVEFLQAIATLQKTVNDIRRQGPNPVTETLRGVMLAGQSHILRNGNGKP